MKSSINEKEIAHFSKDAARWWDETGPFAPLHRLTPARMEYIRGHVCGHFGLEQNTLKPFKNLSVIDIGCGGGLACEPMARLGANVTGIDADPVAIAAARTHAAGAGLIIEFLNTTAESLLDSSLRAERSNPLLKESGDCFVADASRNDGNSFDVVLALEIIEHVNDPSEFVKSCAKLLKPGGLIIFSTLNRTPKSFALGIIAAEYILGWVPKGTHDWKKFVKPSELARFVRAYDLQIKNVSGLVYSPVKQEFRLSENDTDVNYFMSVIRMT
ncbi:MAG: bifunctional 2-polyprenyl-6-hydroxyphenol methylase/3-demethylubiquinol 3-O-methyltransferase UbiG [Alphaproteobacteria bacterium]